MRYYHHGDPIYIFGFSRGAYTARFLSEMLDKIGLLSRGNEEMIRFAWRTYEKYEKAANAARRSELEQYMREFKDTFCRSCVRIRVLGLFDCVNSVGSLEVPLFRRSFSTVASPAAEYVRHAVAIDERRAKFKPALFDIKTDPLEDKPELKEVWFPGDHCDIGGGWNPGKGGLLLSDISLAWMLREIISLPIPEGERLSWKMDEVNRIIRAVDESVMAEMHDSLGFRLPYDASSESKGALSRVSARLFHSFRTANWWFMGMRAFPQAAVSNIYKNFAPYLLVLNLSRGNGSQHDFLPMQVCHAISQALQYSTRPFSSEEAETRNIGPTTMG